MFFFYTNVFIFAFLFQLSCKSIALFPVDHYCPLVAETRSTRQAAVWTQINTDVIHIISYKSILNQYWMCPLCPLSCVLWCVLWCVLCVLCVLCPLTCGSAPQLVIMSVTVLLAYYLECTELFGVHLQGFFCHDPELLKPYPGADEGSLVPPLLLYCVVAATPTSIVSTPVSPSCLTLLSHPPVSPSDVVHPGGWGGVCGGE